MNPKPTNIPKRPGNEQNEVVALRRDLIAAMSRLMDHQPMHVDEINCLCGLSQAYRFLSEG